MAGDRYETPPAWKAADAVAAVRKAARQRDSAEARPVRIISVDVSFGTVFIFALYFTIAQAIIGAAILGALFALGVV